MSLPRFLSVGKVKLVIYRHQPGAYVAGRWVESTNKELIEIEANVQPALTNKELILLPEGDRTKDVLKVYTTTTLRGRREGQSPLEADTFIWEGDTYEVVLVHSYKMGVLDHSKAICVRKELT